MSFKFFKDYYISYIVQYFFEQIKVWFWKRGWNWLLLQSLKKVSITNQLSWTSHSELMAGSWGSRRVSASRAGLPERCEGWGSAARGSAVRGRALGQRPGSTDWEHPGGLRGWLDVSCCLTQFPPDIDLPFLQTQLYLVHYQATVVSGETLWSNKSLFTKPGSGPDLTCGLQFVDPQIKHECLSPPQRTPRF